MSSPSPSRSAPKSRRRFLKWGALGLFGAAAVAGGGAFVLVRPGAIAAGRKTLSEDEVLFLEAAAATYFPAGNGLGLDVGSLDVAGAMDEILAGFPSFERTLVRGVFNFFDAWPRLSFSSLSRFTDQSHERRVEYLRAFDSSHMMARRGLGEALRALLGLAVFSRPAALAAVGHVDGCGRFPWADKTMGRSA